MARLLGLSRAEQEGAKRLFTWSRAAHCVTLAAALATQFAYGEPAYALALVALATEAAAWLMRIAGERRHALAEQARRRALLADALDRSLEALALRDLGTRFSGRARRDAASLDDPNYYASEAPRGLERLREQVRESAFWSRCLYASAGKLALAIAALLIVLVIAALLTVAGSGGKTELVVARIGVVFLSFIVFSDVLTHALGWLEAASKSDEVYLVLATPLCNTAQAIAIFSDYSVVTAGAAPIPTWLYSRRHDDVEQAWHAALGVDGPTAGTA
jgi:hypothetical protein